MLNIPPHISAPRTAFTPEHNFLPSSNSIFYGVRGVHFEDMRSKKGITPSPGWVSCCGFITSPTELLSRHWLLSGYKNCSKRSGLKKKINVRCTSAPSDTELSDCEIHMCLWENFFWKRWFVEAAAIAGSGMGFAFLSSIRLFQLNPFYVTQPYNQWNRNWTRGKEKNKELFQARRRENKFDFYTLEVNVPRPELTLQRQHRAHFAIISDWTLQTLSLHQCWAAQAEHQGSDTATR